MPVAMRHALGWPILVLLTSLAMPFTTCAVPSINQFEVKDLEVEPGALEFQSQNAWSFGQPARQFAADDEGFEYDDNSASQLRFALELERGLSPWLRGRIGVEFEQERVDDPAAPALREDFDALSLDELAIEGVAVLWPRRGDGIGLGLLMEYQHQVESDEANSLVAGPVIEGVWSAWSLIINPALVRFFGGEPTDNKTDFTYAAQIAREVDDHVLLGLEFYGVVERLGHSGRPAEGNARFGDHDQHRLGPAVYYRTGLSGNDDGATVNLGLGWFFGLNTATSAHTLKWSVEIDF